MLEPHVRVIEEECIGCGLCIEVCPATPTVFEMRDITAFAINPEACERCMLCTDSCPTDAIILTREEDMMLGLGDI